MRTTLNIDDKMIGTMPLAVMFDTSSIEQMKKPEILNQIREFQIKPVQ